MSTGNNSSSGIIEDTRDENLAKIEILTLSIILVLAITGNGLMVIALRRQLNFRPMSRMYFFMFNLSVSDLLVAFGNILPQLAWDITYRFKGNDSLCRLIKFLQIFVLYLSTFVLTSMAVDRYMVICHQTFSRTHYGGLKVPKVMVVLSWILALVFASPQAVIFTMAEVKPGVIDCWTFLDSGGQKAYVTWFVCSVFILPLVIVGWSYGAICVKVTRFSVPSRDNGGVPINSGNSNALGYGKYKRKSSFSSSSTKTDSETMEAVMNPLQKDSGYKALRRQVGRAKVKTLKLTLVVVLCFFVCWAPFCVTQLVMVYHPVGPLYVILLLLASLNSCTNPWIYLVFSESLCNQLRMLLGIERFGLKRSSNGESIGDEQDVGGPQVIGISKGIEKKARGGEYEVKSLPRKNVSFSNQDIQDDLQIQPETKSEML